jgi:HAD superfamily hydrolase (TIGR01549 family)
MAPSMIEAALIDVDGTLIDDNALHVLAWSRAFRRMGHEIDAGTILHAIGMGGDRLVPALLDGADAATLDRANQLHAEEYLKKGLIDAAEVLPGARELLAGLQARGVRTALASSAKAGELDRYLEMLGGAGVVDAIVTGDDVSATKPSPELFEAALAKLGSPADAVVIGDTVYDVRAAGKLGLPCIGVLTGGIERRELENAGARAIYEGARALAGDLDRALA